MILLVGLGLLSGCPAPSIGAECVRGTARCNDGVVEHCDCENLGGSGPYAMDVCTSRYRWLRYYSRQCEEDEVCVEDGGYAGCAAPAAQPCDPGHDAPWCDGLAAMSCIPLKEGPRAPGTPDNSGPGRWHRQECDPVQTCVVAASGPYPRAYCDGKVARPLDPPGERFVGWVRSAEARGFTASEPVCQDGADLPVAREQASLRGEWQDCAVSLVRGGHEVVVSELQFAGADDASGAVTVLRGRAQGADPAEACAVGGAACRALVSGWAVDDRVYWVTVRSVAAEAEGCAVIAANPDAQDGMFRCGGGK